MLYEVFQSHLERTDEKLPSGQHWYRVVMVRCGCIYASSVQHALRVAKADGIKAPIVGDGTHGERG